MYIVDGMIKASTAFKCPRVDLSDVLGSEGIRFVILLRSPCCSSRLLRNGDAAAAAAADFPSLAIVIEILRIGITCTGDRINARRNLVIRA